MSLAITVQALLPSTSSTPINKHENLTEEQIQEYKHDASALVDTLCREEAYGWITKQIIDLTDGSSLHHINDIDESLEDLEEFTSSDFSDLLGTLNSPGKGTNFDNEGDEHESSRDDIGDDYDYDYDHERNTFKRRTVMEKDLVYDHNSGHTLQKLSEGNWIESIIPKPHRYPILASSTNAPTTPTSKQHQAQTAGYTFPPALVSTYIQPIARVFYPRSIADSTKANLKANAHNNSNEGRDSKDELNFATDLQMNIDTRHLPIEKGRVSWIIPIRGAPSEGTSYADIRLSVCIKKHNHEATRDLGRERDHVTPFPQVITATPNNLLQPQPQDRSHTQPQLSTIEWTPSLLRHFWDHLRYHRTKNALGPLSFAFVFASKFQSDPNLTPVSKLKTSDMMDIDTKNIMDTEELAGTKEPDIIIQVWCGIEVAMNVRTVLSVFSVEREKLKIEDVDTAVQRNERSIKQMQDQEKESIPGEQEIQDKERDRRQKHTKRAKEGSLIVPLRRARLLLLDEEGKALLVA